MADKKNSDEREYTEGTQMFQEFERGMTRAAYRLTHGFSEGVRTYYEEGEKSAAKKQDGALRDSLSNAALGFSVAAGEMSKAPYEIAKATDSDAAWDLAQSVNRTVERTFRGKKDDDEAEAENGES